MSTAFEHVCLPVAAAQFWRADALEVASALPFEFDVTLRPRRMTGTRINEEKWGSRGNDGCAVAMSSEEY